MVLDDVGRGFGKRMRSNVCATKQWSAMGGERKRKPRKGTTRETWILMYCVHSPEVHIQPYPTLPMACKTCSPSRSSPRAEKWRRKRRLDQKRPSLPPDSRAASPGPSAVLPHSRSQAPGRTTKGTSGWPAARGSCRWPTLASWAMGVHRPHSQERNWGNPRARS